MRNYLKAFIKKEDGMETIEFVVILAVVAGLIVIITGVGATVRNKATDAQEVINNGMDSINYGTTEASKISNPV